MSPVIEIRRDVALITVHSASNRADKKSALLNDIGRLGPLCEPSLTAHQTEPTFDLTSVHPTSGLDLVVGHLESHLAEYQASGIAVDSDVALLLLPWDLVQARTELLPTVARAVGQACSLLLVSPAGKGATAFVVPRGQAEAAVSAIRTALTDRS